MTSLIDPRKPLELARNCPVDIYLSGHEGAGYGKTYFPWPYRMSRPGETLASYFNDCDKYILDSGIHREEITNSDVIREAKKVKPDYIIAADVLYKPEITTEKIFEFLDLLEEHSIDAKPIIPLQPSQQGETDHWRHFQDLNGLSDYYAIGGVLGIPSEKKQEAARKVREKAGENVKLHGLAFDIKYFNSPEIIKEPYIDSIDSSSPIQDGRKGLAWAYTADGIERLQYPEPKGPTALLQVSLHSGLSLVTTARLILNEFKNDIEFKGKSQPNNFGVTMTRFGFGGSVKENKDGTQKYENGHIEVSAKTIKQAVNDYPDEKEPIAVAKFILDSLSDYTLIEEN